VDIELEDLNDYRFYKLEIDSSQRCDGYVANVYDTKDKLPRKCNGMLWLYRHNGTIYKRCRHTDCLKVHEIKKKCSHCGTEHDFEDITCDKCESDVIHLASYKVNIDESEKAIKKINRAYKVGKISEEDWKSAIKLNKQEIENCQKGLQEIKTTLRAEGLNIE
jgi:DNA repair exonuclease SbcCD ATPase subunit